MKCNLCLTYLGQAECPSKLLPPLFYGELPASPIRVGKAIIAVASLKTRKTRLFTSLAASEEILKSLIKPSEHILQHMSGYILVLFPYLCLDFRQIILLVRVTNRF